MFCLWKWKQENKEVAGIKMLEDGRDEEGGEGEGLEIKGAWKEGGGDAENGGRAGGNEERRD